MRPDTGFSGRADSGIVRIEQPPVAEKHPDFRPAERYSGDVPLAQFDVVGNFRPDGLAVGKDRHRLRLAVFHPEQPDAVLVRAKVQQIIVRRILIPPDDAGAPASAPAFNLELHTKVAIPANHLVEDRYRG